METVPASLTARISRLREKLVVTLTFDYGRLNKRYLPPKHVEMCNPIEGGYVVHKVMELTDAKYWEDVNNSRVRIKCKFDKLIAIGHPIEDIWLETDTD